MQCDVVLANLSICLSVCLSSAGTVSKQMDISSHFFNLLVEASFWLFGPTAVTEFQWESLNTYTGVGKVHSFAVYVGNRNSTR